MLYQDRRLDAGAVMRVALEMVDKHGYSLEALRNSLQDILRRGRLAVPVARELGAQVVSKSESAPDQVPALGALPAARELVRGFAERLRELGPVAVPPADLPPVSAIDYLAAMEEDLPRRRPRKKE